MPAMSESAFTDPFAPQRKRRVSLLGLVAGLIFMVGIPVTFYRFYYGLGAATNLSGLNPWGLWIGFDVMTGVALAAGGYTIAATVYIFGLKEYYPVLRPAVLTGFLGYFFVVVGLVFDLGRPWRLPYPMVYSYGVTSVMFLIAWHVALYLTCQFVEFCPAVFEWLGWKNFRSISAKMAVGATAFGVILSTLHQSALGALFLMAPSKVHPLWYSPFIPVFFFISSIAAGLGMVIVESMLSHKIFHYQFGEENPVDLDALQLGLARAAAVVLLVYFAIKWVGVADGQAWEYLSTTYGRLFLVEMFGFVLLPCIMFTWAVQTRNVLITRVAAAITVLGICFNRLNVSIITFNWHLPAVERYFPSWMEITVTVTIVTIGILTFRWIVRHMPVLRPHPEYPWER